ncbi:uncharacterized protein Triagg1_4524 [Trichoderma aggressivum f. europaeum]|uniref:Uncharacterized protein n=1 Tax=Trichoderma aggressivum f. europaeum TaxID=173218 RepID=A0AAE1IDW3_9HYPO|nr:hypothetical protein Triagg1_4524 [Trichoderma aggressivum f. europaeum]
MYSTARHGTALWAATSDVQGHGIRPRTLRAHPGKASDPPDGVPGPLKRPSMRAHSMEVHVQAIDENMYLYGPGFQMPASAVCMEQAVPVPGTSAAALRLHASPKKAQSLRVLVPPLILIPLSGSDLESLASANLGVMTSMPFHRSM